MVFLTPNYCKVLFTESFFEEFCLLKKGCRSSDKQSNKRMKVRSVTKVIVSERTSTALFPVTISKPPIQIKPLSLTMQHNFKHLKITRENTKIYSSTRHSGAFRTLSIIKDGPFSGNIYHLKIASQNAPSKMLDRVLNTPM